MRAILFVARLIFRLVNGILYRMTLAYYKSRGLKIGRNVRLFGRVDRVNPHLVSIGDNVVIGLGSRIITHGPVKGGRPVTIGSDVYVGANVIILPGVTIGDGCLIGAGSVVTKDVPPMSIAAGNPAGVLRPRDPEELARTRECLEKGLPVGQVPCAR